MRRQCRAPARTPTRPRPAGRPARGTPRTARARCPRRSAPGRCGSRSPRSTSTSSRPVSASSRTTSPSRTRASGPPAAASGVQWIAAGTLPDAPDMRPSVTSATRWPRSCSTPSAGVSLCSSGMPFARGPWLRTTATWSWSRSPRSNASRKCDWSSNTRAGAVTTRCSGATAETLMTARPSGAVEHADAAVGRERGAGRPQHAAVARLALGRPPAQLALVVEVRLVAVAPEAVAGDRVDVRVQQPGVEQLAEQERHAAGGVEVVDVGGAVGIDAREQRHDRREVGEVVPRQLQARGGGDRDQMHGVVRRAAGGQQRHDTVDERALVEDLADRRAAVRRAPRGLLGQRAPQRRARVDEARARQVQAHRLDHELVRVRGAVERARAGRVIGLRLGLEQLLAADLALRVELADPATSRRSAGPTASARRARRPSAGGRTRARRSAGPARSCRTRRASARRRTCRARARPPWPSPPRRG